MISFLTGSYTKRGSNGINRVEFDPATLGFTTTQIADVSNPTYLTHSQDMIFSVGQVLDQAGVILLKDGVVKDMLLLEQKVPCHISYNEKLHHIYTANYHEGHIMIIELKDEQLHHVQTISFPQGSKAHYVSYDEALDCIIMCDLGLDCVRAFRWNNEKYELLWEEYFPKGSGPRHCVKHPTLSILYVLCELSGEIYTCDISRYRLSIILKALVYPPTFKPRWAAAIRITKDGRNLYTSNRGHDSITLFIVDQHGHLHFESRVSTRGKQPRDFNLLGNDQYLCVLNHDDDKCVIFKRDDHGALTFLAQHQILEGVCVEELTVR
jgi:6-phosphogluconolactonase